MSPPPARRGVAARAPDEPTVRTLAKQGRFVVAEPVFEAGPRYSLDNRALNGARVGDLVLVGGGKRGARVLRRIGRPDTARDVVEALMLDRGLRRSFPAKVDDEARDAAERPSWQGERRDLTALSTFTVDPADAQDFDDAISAERAEGGVARIWVHIADVSAFVRPGSVLERETFRRATSTYVPGAVEPMLPQALSNEACSLVPGVERPAVTVEMDFRGAEVIRTAFHRSTIRSDARLDYDQVDRVFAGTEPAREPWGQPLGIAREVAAALADKRARQGALEVVSSEARFEFDSGGNVAAVHREVQTESHSVIEHLMVVANERVAGHLADTRTPALYRVHERPEPRSVVTLVEKLASLGVPTPPLPKSMTPQQAGDLVGEISRGVAKWIRRKGHGQALSSLVLRSLKQAVYSERNLGHAGLRSPRYCHFTSPIRRYPDLVCHRALLANLGLDDAPPPAHELSELAEHCSQREREAMVVERDADDVCLAFLLEQRLAEGDRDRSFEGEVVGVIGAGAFIRFGDEGFEGFVPRRRIRGDRYELNEQETMLVGMHGGKAIRFGDPVEVTVARVEPLRGRCDLLFSD